MEDGTHLIHIKGSRDRVAFRCSRAGDHKIELEPGTAGQAVTATCTSQRVYLELVVTWIGRCRKSDSARADAAGIRKRTGVNIQCCANSRTWSDPERDGPWIGCRRSIHIYRKS